MKKIQFKKILYFSFIIFQNKYHLIYFINETKNIYFLFIFPLILFIFHLILFIFPFNIRNQ